MIYRIDIQTPLGESLIDVTQQVRDAIAVSGIAEGICVLFVPHTTAALTLNSALDAATPRDLIDEMQRFVPKRVDFQHQYDTPADAAGHIKAALIGHSATLIIDEGKLTLGGSQSILFFEFDGPRKRHIQLKIMAGGA